jgi:light-harvesting complex II chlorophyll a/b binding protein 4
MLSLAAATTAFAAPMSFAQPMRAPMVRMNADADVVEPAASAAVDTATVKGVVVPSGAEAPKLKPHEWNPKGLDVEMLPEMLGPVPIKAQFDAEYLKTAPTYLDGSLPGDIGFDPWCLTALANPKQEMDKTSRTAAERKAIMLSMTEEEQKANLAWMRDAELKHARLAMLAAAGWPMAELVNGPYLHSFAAGGLNGRAPSLFNGQLIENLPFVVLVFGGLAALEYTTKDTVKGGDYGFDPLGFSTGKIPGPWEGAGEGRPHWPNVGDMEALKLAEIKNGRAAMMAITGFAVQEFFYGTPVVDQTPFFFGFAR